MIGTNVYSTEDPQRDVTTFYASWSATRGMLMSLSPDDVKQIASALAQQIIQEILTLKKKGLPVEQSTPGHNLSQEAYKRYVLQFEEQLLNHTTEYTAAKTAQKQGTYHDPNQQSIFDVLKPEAWGDAKPFEKSAASMYEMQQQIRQTGKNLKALENDYVKQTDQQEVDLTCPWCGHAAENLGDLEAHEEACAPEA
jgi:hypothetical protein